MGTVSTQQSVSFFVDQERLRPIHQQLLNGLTCQVLHPAIQLAYKDVRVVSALCCHQLPQQKQGNAGVADMDLDPAAEAEVIEAFTGAGLL